MLFLLRNENIKSYLQSLLADATNYSWKAVRKIRHIKTPIPPNKEVTTFKPRVIKKKLLLLRLKKCFQPFPSQISAENDDEINEYHRSPCQLSLPLSPIRISEVKWKFNNLNATKLPVLIL